MTHLFEPLKLRDITLRNPCWPMNAARELGLAASWPLQYLRAAPMHASRSWHKLPHKARLVPYAGMLALANMLISRPD